MTLHAIAITPAGRGYRATFKGRDLGVFDNPILAACRTELCD